MFLQKNFNYLKCREDVSYREIAKETGINTNTLQILSKQNDENMRIVVVLKLADFFKVSLDEFVKKDLTSNSKRMTSDWYKNKKRIRGNINEQ